LILENICLALPRGVLFLYHIISVVLRTSKSFLDMCCGKPIFQSGKSNRGFRVNEDVRMEGSGCSDFVRKTEIVGTEQA